MVITAPTRKRMTILEAPPENVLIFQCFRGIMQKKSSRFSLLFFSPFSLMFWEHQKHNLIRRCIEVVITAPTRNRMAILEASFENVMIFQGFHGIIWKRF